MEFTPETTALLAHLESESGKPLNMKEDLGLLIDTAQRRGAVPMLDELSFYAKFAHKAYGIMNRIGKENEGYDNLAREFAGSLEKIRELLLALLHHEPAATRTAFQRKFLEMTPQSMQNLLILLHDLSWYKNYSIDRKQAQRGNAG